MPLGCATAAAHLRISTGILLAALAVGTLAGLGSAAPAGQSPKDYTRADAETIKAHTRQIISSPQFAPRITPWQWLMRKLGRWDLPGVDLPEGVGTLFSTVVTVWCVLTLIAILAHLAWTIWLFAHRPGARIRDGSGRRLDTSEITCPEQLWQMSQELAQQGSFREAVSVLLLSLLRRLDATEVLRFHKSKTNGEYLQEYPDRLGGHREFMQFITTFERTIYGGLEIHRPAYEAMTSLAKRITDDVSPHP